MRDSDNRIATGIFCMIGFCLIAPVMDAMAKATPREVPVTQILAARFGLQAVLLWPMAYWLSAARWGGWRDAGLHLLRGGTMLAATGFFFTAVRYMPIANAISIFFVAPFILLLFGALVLGEPIGWRRILACCVGFLGAMIVIRPSFSALGLVALLPLGTAVFFAIYMLMTRAMSQRIAPLTLQAHTALAASALIVPPLLWMEGSGVALWDPIWPTGAAVWTLLGVGVIASVSHLLITYALQLAPASVIGPLQYLEIIGATVVGYLWFGDFPDRLTWLGIAVIVASGLYIVARERHVARQATP